MIFQSTFSKSHSEINGPLANQKIFRLHSDTYDFDTY